MADPGSELVDRGGPDCSALEAAARFPRWPSGPVRWRSFINLLAAGGIGIPTVALALWSIVALGLNLRDDRPCSRLREYESRMPALGMAVAWSALLGTFVGLVSPFWRCEAAIARARRR